jgi:hypothetical protein
MTKEFVNSCYKTYGYKIEIQKSCRLDNFTAEFELLEGRKGPHRCGLRPLA